jgi:thiamine pyrophosphate-dependent acetolactate synthase large subunit-like protein
VTQRAQVKGSDGDPSSIERPGGLPSTGSAAAPDSVPSFGSDVVAQTLRDLGVPYIAINPGASFRGLHDSLVNFLGNTRPQILLCLHEEHAVAIAHGYAKVTGAPLAVVVHSNVGLMHATMAIFNAWCDRMPVVVLGATGPVDATKRRPWIDWIHTARDQGALVRPYVKWDDQPASPAAARESLLRATWLASTAPQAPVYVNLDAELQEARLAAPLPPIASSRYMPSAVSAPVTAVVADVASLLRSARAPVLLIGRVTRDERAWQARVQLAEAIGAKVITDLKVGAAFPTEHPLHVGAPAVILQADAAAAIAAADVIVSLDWVDLAGTLKAACGGEPVARVVHVSLDHVLHNGWSMDHQGLPAVDVHVAATPEATVPALLEAVGGARAPGMPPRPHAFAPAPAGEGAMTTDDVAVALRGAAGERAVSLLHLPLSWNGASWPFRHPLDFLGSDGGGGIGGGPGIAVGAALALAGSGRLAVAVCGDGDFLMGVTALWTAVHYRVPLLVVVANNRTFYNDEVHQERMARMRDRPVANKWIGQRISDPDVDLAGMARAQGAEGFGPVEKRDDLPAALAAAIRVVARGGVAVVDAIVRPGYTPAMNAVAGPGMTTRG